MPIRLTIASLAVALSFAFAASAQADIYWAEPLAGSIGRSNNDGSGVENGFIKTGGEPIAVAVDSTHVYWANESAGMIGRANIDGTAVEPSFITGIKEPRSVVVNSSFIFWASFSGGEIGRANLDGSKPNLAFVPAAGSPCSIAIDGGHIYWGNAGLNSYIARSSLQGNSKELEWVSLGTYVPCGIATNSTNVFFGNLGFLGGFSHEIGRVSISGMGLDESIIGEANGPCGLAVFGSQLYWANQGGGTIGVANTDASLPDESLVTTGATEPCGVAVDSLVEPIVPPPSNPSGPGSGSGGSDSGGSGQSGPPAATPTAGTLKIAGVKYDKKNGSARVSLTVNEAGTVSLTGKGVLSAKAQAAGAGTVTLPVRRGLVPKRSLKRNGKLVAKFVAVFTPSGGGASAAVSKGLTLHEQTPRRKWTAPPASRLLG
jgi:hypothetical protein